MAGRLQEKPGYGSSSLWLTEKIGHLFWKYAALNEEDSAHLVVADHDHGGKPTNAPGPCSLI